MSQKGDFWLVGNNIQISKNNNNNNVLNVSKVFFIINTILIV